MTNEEINNSKRSEEQSEGVDIYNEIRKEIERVIDTENPNNFGDDDFDQENYKDVAEEAYDNYYSSQSEGRDFN
tara:strand:+ start:285 stop:506 length:222 start_codon:yes stop_codon:yes gene_type:complete